MEIKYSEWRDSVKEIQEMLEIQSSHIKCLIKNNAPKKFIAQAKEMYVYYYKLKVKKYKQKYIIDATRTPTK
jgi:predicted transcriptional regulator